MKHKNRVEQIEAQIKALPIVKNILQILERELSPTLLFHSLNHTLDVLHESIVFGVAGNLDDRQLLLLGIAAVFHDVGFLQAPNPNELIGAEIARDTLRLDGSYTDEELQLVAKMIANTDTRDHAAIKDPLSGYSTDADVSNLGRTDFFDKATLFARETGRQEDEAYLKYLLNMLEQHSWHTQPAIQLRQAQKEKNIAQVKLKMSKK